MEQIPAGQIRFSTEKLQKRIRELGQEIGQDYAGQELILIT